MRPHASIRYRLTRHPIDEMQHRAEAFFTLMSDRRTVRDFSADPVPIELIELAIATASTSPSGAHRQPWTFVAISDAEIKRRIRIGAEAEEQQSYDGGRMPREWREALAPIGTDANKPFLEVVPWIVVIFEQSYGINPDGTTFKNYYVKESVGIACGIFIATLHNMGLASLTHTPSPMRFLNEILERPKNEKPYVMIPIGFPTEDCRVPDLTRKGLDQVSVWF